MPIKKVKKFTSDLMKYKNTEIPEDEEQGRKLGARIAQQEDLVAGGLLNVFEALNAAYPDVELNKNVDELEGIYGEEKWDGMEWVEWQGYLADNAAKSVEEYPKAPELCRAAFSRPLAQVQMSMAPNAFRPFEEDETFLKWIAGRFSDRRQI